MNSFQKKTIIFLAVVAIAIVGIVFYLKPSKVPQPVQNNSSSSVPFTLEPHVLTAAGTAFSLSIPKGFNIATAATGLNRVRFMAKSPDGRLFVTDMKDLSDNSEGKIYILDHFNTATKKFESRTTYLSGLRNPNSVAFYTDPIGVNWLYVALTDQLVRYRFTLGEIVPTSAPEVLATFPAYGLSYKYGGWHLTRTVKVHNDKVYVSVGSSCDSCEEKTEEPMRASIIQMDANGSNQQIIASGLRNAVGLYFKGDQLYVSAMGADKLGDDKPEEALYLIKPGTNYGWPYCYQYQSKIYTNNTQAWDHPIDCSAVPSAAAAFPAHAAPLGLAFFGASAALELANSFLLSLHGSSTVSLAHGYKIVHIDQQGTVTDFVTGFLHNGTCYARPVDILPDSDSSFFFTDDFGGNLYYVYK